MGQITLLSPAAEDDTKTLRLSDLPKLTELVNKHWDSADESSTLWPQSVPGGQLSSDKSVDGLRQFPLGGPTLGFSNVLSFLGPLHFALLGYALFLRSGVCPPLPNKLDLTPIHPSSLNHEVIFPRKSWCSPDLMCMLSIYT